eukprot:tig00001029_g6413.t1
MFASPAAPALAANAAGALGKPSVISPAQIRMRVDLAAAAASPLRRSFYGALIRPSSIWVAGGRQHTSVPFSARAIRAASPFIIGVAGGTASGKTTVCDKIIEHLQDKRVVNISQDAFYRTLPDDWDPSAINWDHPDAFDNDLMLDTLAKLKNGQPVDIPVYNFAKNSRTEETQRVEGSEVILFEGILVFYSKLRELMDMKIFVDADADTRLARRVQRDILERGRDVMGVLHQYEHYVKPAYEEYIMPTKKHADIIIPRGGENTVAIDLIVQHIRQRLLGVAMMHG